LNTSLSRREREYLAGKSRPAPGGPADRKLRERIRKKLGGVEFAAICVYCDRAFSEGRMWQISAGDNAVYACPDCVKNKIRSRKVTVTQQGIRPAA